jgi:hypothetical protein
MLAWYGATSSLHHYFRTHPFSYLALPALFSITVIALVSVVFLRHEIGVGDVLAACLIAVASFLVHALQIWLVPVPMLRFSVCLFSGASPISIVLSAILAGGFRHGPEMVCIVMLFLLK